MLYVKNKHESYVTCAAAVIDYRLICNVQVTSGHHKRTVLRLSQDVKGNSFIKGNSEGDWPTGLYCC